MFSAVILNGRIERSIFRMSFCAVVKIAPLALLPKGIFNWLRVDAVLRSLGLVVSTVNTIHACTTRCNNTFKTGCRCQEDHAAWQ